MSVNVIVVKCDGIFLSCLTLALVALCFAGLTGFMFASSSDTINAFNTFLLHLAFVCVGLSSY